MKRVFFLSLLKPLELPLPPPKTTQPYAKGYIIT